jgi:hypothetical protein
MSTAHIRAVVAAAALLSGCAPTGDSPNQVSHQIGVNRLHDWDATVARVAQSMAQRGVIVPANSAVTTTPTAGPYYVHVMAPGSTFLEEARRAMESELLRRGAEVARSPAQATVINLDLDVIRWASGPVFPTTAEIEWRATIVSGNRELVRSGETLSIAANDLSLYASNTTLAAIASPGVSLLGVERPLRYAR